MGQLRAIFTRRSPTTGDLSESDNPDADYLQKMERPLHEVWFGLVGC